MGTIREQILLASSLTSGTIRELLANPNTGSGDGSIGIVIEEPDSVIVSEVEAAGVVIEEADFDVKIVQKETIVTKE